MEPIQLLKVRHAGLNFPRRQRKIEYKNLLSKFERVFLTKPWSAPLAGDFDNCGQVLSPQGVRRRPLIDIVAIGLMLRIALGNLFGTEPNRGTIVRA